MKKILFLMSVLMVGCLSLPPIPKPSPTTTPSPTPTPSPSPSATPTPGPGSTCDAPSLWRYVLSGHVHPANPDLWFWSITPQVNDRTYCAPNVVCPYGPEGSPERDKLEQECAYPTLV